MTRGQIRCQRARDLIPAYLDGALTLGDREQLEAHLASCPLCARELHNIERLDMRTRLALRSVAEEYTLAPQREAQIRSRLLQAATSAQRRRPRLNMSNAAAALAALIFIVSAGLATLRPTPPPSEQRGFVSYASGPADRDLIFSERGRGTIQAPVTITFLDSTLPEQTYASLVESFQAANPDVTVAVRRPEGTLTDPGFLADEGDCFVASADIDGPYIRDQLRPITRFAQADAQIHTDDFFPPLLDLVRTNDQLYGLPRAAQLRLAFFDLRTLVQYGVVPPDAHWTSDGLAARVEQLRERLPAGSYAFVPYDGYDAAYLLTQRGARAPHAGDVRLDTSATLSAVNWYNDLIRTVSPDAQSLNDSQSIARRQQLVATDHVAIWSAPPMSSHKLTPSTGIVPLPTDPERPGALQADAYFISKHTSGSRAGACWRWIRFLSFQTFAWDRVPARSSQVQSHSFISKFGQRQTQVVIAALSYPATIDPWTPTTVAALTDAIDDIVLRGAPPRSALQRVQRYLDAEW